MTVTPEPDPPDWDVFSGSAIEFTNAQSNAVNNGWDSNNMAIKDANGTPNYLYFGASAITASHLAWYFRNSGNVGSAAPFCRIPQDTFNVIAGGTLDKATGKITYGGNVYWLRIHADGNGVIIAEATAP